MTDGATEFYRKQLREDLGLKEAIVSMYDEIKDILCSCNNIEEMVDEMVKYVRNREEG
jgi:hypothetical protein